MNYHIGRLVLSSLHVGALVAVGIWWCSFCRLQPAKRTPPNTSRNQSSNTQRTENKTTYVVIHLHSRKLLKMDILISETCWAHNKWNKLASDIKFVFHSSTLAMMHGPINIRYTKSEFIKEISACSFSWVPTLLYKLYVAHAVYPFTVWPYYDVSQENIYFSSRFKKELK